MSVKELKRAEVIQQAEDQKNTVLQASQELEISVRQVRRFKACRAKGAEGLLHGSRRRKTGRRAAKAVRERVSNPVRGEYRD